MRREKREGNNAINSGHYVLSATLKVSASTLLGPKSYKIIMLHNFQLLVPSIGQQGWETLENARGMKGTLGLWAPSTLLKGKGLTVLSQTVGAKVQPGTGG